MKIGAILLSLGVALPVLAGNYTGLKTSSPDGYRSRGLMMYENENYIGAIDQLSHLYMTEGGEVYDEDADFYIALSTYEHGDFNCIEMFKKFIAEHPASIKVAYAHAKIGDCYFFQGQDIEEANSKLTMDDPKYAEGEAKVKDFYGKAQPFYEKAKELAPDNKQLWGQFLLRIYWKLNKAEYDALEKELGY